MDRPDDCLRHMGFELPQLRPREHRIVDAIFVEHVRLLDRLAEALLRATTIEPTSPVHEGLSRSACLGDQGLMFVDALGHQGGERPRRSLDPFGRRVLPVAEEPRRDPWQG